MALLGAAYGLRESATAWLAQHWQGEMDIADEARAVALVARVDGLGEAGLPVLVQSLDSSRECVARAARQTLSARLDEWKWLDAKEASPKLARLAASLAAEVESLGPEARLDAAGLAVRILHRPLDAKVVDRREVVAACEEVLLAARAARPDLARRRGGASDGLVEGPAMGGAAASSAGDLGERNGAEPRGPSIPELAALPGGNLPDAPLADDGPDAMPGSPRASAGTVPQEPQRLDRPLGAQPLEPRGQPPRLLSNSASPGRPLGKSPSPTAGDRSPGGTATSPEGVASDRGGVNKPLSLEEPRASSSGLAAAKTLDLIRGLGDGEAFSAAAAQAELARRGFGEVELAVGRQLFDPDPEVRKRLARTLPAMRSIRAEPWLLWLAEDANAEVREAAVGLLATSNDPALLAQVEQLAQADADARVRRHAALIARRRAAEQL